MNYVVSDIHGRLDRLKNLVRYIDLTLNDTLYILGDMIDRGDDSIGVIRYAMGNKNIVPIMGNHERMMLLALKYNDEAEMECWDYNGNKKTKEDFNSLSIEEQMEILDYLDSLDYFKVIDDKYLLVHAGIENTIYNMDIGFMGFREALYAQEEELVWVRDAFLKYKAPGEYVVIFGHTPRPSLDSRLGVESEKPYKIWFDKTHNDKICIDTGNCCDGGRMGCLRLDDLEEFYVE